MNPISEFQNSFSDSKLNFALVIQNGEKCYQFQIRKDNPYRKPSADGKQPSGANQNSLSYDRIFSDLSASNDDELLNISAIGSSRTGGNEKSNKVRERIFWVLYNLQSCKSQFEGNC